jgi:hypothetical protein
MDLGTWGIRNIRGGDTLSVHAVGRAWDWRYANPGPGRAAAEEAMAFTIDNHELLGIQAIHDYVDCGGGPNACLLGAAEGLRRSLGMQLFGRSAPSQHSHISTVIQSWSSTISFTGN